MEVKEGKGKLYLIGGSEQFISDIDCKLYQDAAAEPARWWGECAIDRSIKISEKDGYIIELEDGCRGRCFVRKLVNRVLPGIPARSVYRVNGTGLLK
jgi:hypothetical protein